MGGDARLEYSQNGAVYFLTEADLHMHIRNCDYSALDRLTIESIMSRMIAAAEEEEPDNGRMGDIFEMLQREENIKTYIEFFPYFKCLSKMCSLAINWCKDLNIMQREAALKTKLQKVSNDVQVNRTLIENLEFYREIDLESDRLQQQELPRLYAKKDAVLRNKLQIESKLANFIEQFFE